MLRPLGGEIARAGLVDARAKDINALLARLGALESELTQAIGRVDSPAVAEALALAPASLPILAPTSARYAGIANREDLLASREIFSYDGQPLPCWRPEDLTLYDGWLEHPLNYPIYYRLFQLLGAQRRRLSLLEIGVRTGYMGAAYARAVLGPAYYVGVDPNQYVADGLNLASQTLRFLRERLDHFDYALFDGYSWQRNIQASLAHSGPFDLIHIDGDHSLAGKLVDLDLARTLVAPGGLVLVDDFDYHPPIADAIRRAWALGWYTQFELLPSMRGLAVLSI